MADAERTIPATPHRRREARNKGQVAKSLEINTAFILLVGFVALRYFLPPVFDNLQNTMRFSLQNIGYADFTPAGIWRNVLEFMVRIVIMIFPVILLLSCAAIAASVLQVGFLRSWTALKPQISRLNPVRGMRRFFSYKVLIDFFKSILKLAITSFVAYLVIKGDIEKIMFAIDMSPTQSTNYIAQSAFWVGTKISAALIGLGLADYLYQRWEYEKSLRMTRQEVKDEIIRYEGRPEVKSRIRQIQRQVAMRRMMQDVPKADVVIRNPTHYAVALRYNPKEMAAPMVVAKGARLIAEKIIKIAQENNVPVIENAPLARLMFKLVDIGQNIPLALYQAIADILAYVWKSGKINKGWF